MDYDVNALIGVADKVNWEEEAYYSSVDEHLLVNNLHDHPGAHTITDMKGEDPLLFSQTTRGIQNSSFLPSSSGLETAK